MSFFTTASFPSLTIVKKLSSREKLSISVEPVRSQVVNSKFKQPRLQISYARETNRKACRHFTSALRLLVRCINSQNFLK
jgi:hypothetical protein